MSRVLVVDDDPDLRVLAAEILRIDGHVVDTAPDGTSAIARLVRDPRVDVVVLDVQMPEMDGWSTLSLIRSEPDVGDVPVVLATVKSRGDDLQRGWEIGCDGYLTKPYDLRSLRTVVAEVLGLTQADRAHRRLEALSAITADQRAEVSQPLP